MARTFTYLFGIGATLLLVTLPLPHSADRDTAGLVAVAIAAYLAALGFLVLFDRLPLWFYEATPLLGTILVSLVVYFGGSDAPRGIRRVLLLGRAGRLLLPHAGGRRHPPRARLRRLWDRPARQRRGRGPCSELGAGDGVAVRRRHPDDGAAGPDGAGC